MNGASGAHGTVANDPTFMSLESQKERKRRARLKNILEEVMIEKIPNLLRGINYRFMKLSKYQTR